MLSGVVSSTGVACGNVFFLESPEVGITSGSPKEFDQGRELKEFTQAVKTAGDELYELREDVRINIGVREEMIFEAQSLILDDPILLDEVRDRIINEKMLAEDALKQTIAELEQQFLKIEDKTLRQRITDVKDVGARILRGLGKDKTDRLESITEPVILITKELLPSQAAQLDRDKIFAIVTEKGGINSHASIIARSLDIPAIVGVKGLLKLTQNVKTAIVDGLSGDIYFDPDPKMIDKFKKLKSEAETRKQEEKKHSPGGMIKTLDGEKVYIYANVGRLSELNKLKTYGAEGVGVLRTEFLIIDRQSPPSCEEFINSFKTILEFMSPRPVNIRLLDLGADKTFPFLTHPKEPNPNLGSRGIRFLLNNQHLLKLQLRAILEAGASGNARILIPMVTNIDEIQKIIGIVRSMELELVREGKPVRTQMPIGVMIETPASAIMTDRIAPYIDFFSVGTNDLTQYVLAADRENENVLDIYNSLNPALLRMLKISRDGVKESGIEFAICGEMASSIKAIPILLGMGFRRFSVGVGRIPEVKDIVRKIEIQKAKRLASKALKSPNVVEVEKSVGRFLKKMEKAHQSKVTENSAKIKKV
ncbi:MAG: phosphoenolpyruvate--protein phosphotransferase [Candidatus Eremiobacteraeota bacterium]|nr:phosphoenolpyruvate--protein phosphotransferase [Candidatus Eremiobacteraeota bacterium]